jgi:hypothetical protein
MKLSKILIPEIVKGSRSSGFPINDLFIKECCSRLEFTENGIEYDLDDSNFAHTLSDINRRNAFAQAQRHHLEKAPSYHICEDFAKALLGLRERDIVEEYLPEKFFAYISIPSGIVGNVTGAYIYIGPSDHRGPFLKEHWDKKVIWISYFDEFQTDGFMPMGRLNFYLNDGKNISEIIDFYESDSLDIEGREERRGLGRLLLNAVLYIQSQDPELLLLKPTYKAPVSKQKSHTIDGHLNLCTIPVHAINWDYKKTHLYTDSKIFVDGFLAWRRCGPRHSQIKLSWISEHEKTIKKRL